MVILLVLLLVRHHHACRAALTEAMIERVASQGVVAWHDVDSRRMHNLEGMVNNASPSMNHSGQRSTV